ncbi:MAG TPA: sigma-54 dependent transcriptional regulator [Gammaproteobacteria bacterium]
MCPVSEQARRSAPRRALLLADDDPFIGESLAFVLRDDFEVVLASTRRDANLILKQRQRTPELALVDLGLPPDPHDPSEGFALIGDLLSMNPAMKILVLSGQSDRQNVQHALSLGAADFISKPCDPMLLKARLDHQVMILDAEAHDSRAKEDEVDFIGESDAVRSVHHQVKRFASTPFPILIQGESGTGKELVAKLIHKGGDRAEKPFVIVNCAAFTAELLEAQLFGHARGAFTGATSARGGFFEEAGDGTLFLDEVGEFPLELQPKLLRILENGEYYRIGETRPRNSPARILAASNRDLVTEIREGKFRHDLYHRLSVLTIDVPPLRQRGDDVFLLLDKFRQVYAARVPPFHFEDAARKRWRAYTFPGNVRELRNIVIRLGAKYPGQRIGLTELEAELDSQSEVDAGTIARLAEGNFKLSDVLDDWEQRYIDAALRLSNGNLSEAARLLGVNRTTLYSKIQRLSSTQPE